MSSAHKFIQVSVLVAAVFAGARCGGGPAATGPRITEGITPDPATGRCQMDPIVRFDPFRQGFGPDFDRYSEVAAKDGVAYLGTLGGDGLFVLDVEARRELAWLDRGVGRGIASVAVEGNILAFAPSGAGVIVYDISDPRHPARRGQHVDATYACHTLFVRGEIIYCATGRSRPPHVVLYRVVVPPAAAAPLRLEPVTTYTNPEALSPSPLVASSMLVHDLFVHRRDDRTIAYLAYWQRGLEVLDVTDPAQPRLIGNSAPTPGQWTHSVWVDGAFAYVGEENPGGQVRVYDVSNLAEPRAVGVLASTQGDAASAHNVQVAGGYVYASWYQDGLRAFEARGAAAPAEVGYLHTWNGTAQGFYEGNWDVFVEGGRIYASDIQTGLWVVRHRPTGQPCPPDGPRGGRP